MKVLQEVIIASYRTGSAAVSKVKIMMVKSSTFYLFVIQTSLTASNSTYFVYFCFIRKLIFFLGSFLRLLVCVRVYDMYFYAPNNAVFVLEIRTCFY